MDSNRFLEKGQLSTQIIRSRRSIFPHSYTDEKIPNSLIEEFLENANHAPTHRLTEPWRFKVINRKKTSCFRRFTCQLVQRENV